MATDILHFTMCNVYIVCNVKFIKSGEKGIIFTKEYDDVIATVPSFT